jgi:hypothetical protein
VIRPSDPENRSEDTHAMLATDQILERQARRAAHQAIEFEPCSTGAIERGEADRA